MLILTNIKPLIKFRELLAETQAEVKSYVKNVADSRLATSSMGLKVTRERDSGRKRPSSVKDHKNKTAVETEIALPTPGHSLSQPF